MARVGGVNELSVKSEVLDLGVCQRKGKKDSVLPLRLAKAVQIARQVGIARLERKAKVQQVRSMVYAVGLYGVEVMAATQKFVHGLRKAVAGALWQDKGPRNRVAALSLLNLDPWVHMCVHILTHWWRMAAKGFFEDAGLKAYRETCRLS